MTEQHNIAIADTDGRRDAAPVLSVIIPTYNRADVVRKHLDALMAQDLSPSRFEVLVADDGSTDETPEVLRSVAQCAPFRFWYESARNAGPANARNRALRHAAGRCILFTNDDAVPDVAMLRRHVEFHADHPGIEWGAVGAVHLASVYQPSPLTRIHHAQWVNLARAAGDLPFTSFITANISVKREFLPSDGPFDESLRWHEDVELGRRLLRRGLRLRYLPEAYAEHYHALDEGAFLRMARRDGEQLVAWYRRDPSAMDDLTRMGLAGPPPLRRTLRQRVSAGLVTPATVPLLKYLARSTDSLAPGVAERLWRAVFVHERRQAVLRALQA